MRVRGMLAAGLLLGTGLLGHPATADEDSCGLVQDAANDTAVQGQQQTAGVLVQQPIDVVSVDIATDEYAVYGVVRVQSLQPSSTSLSLDRAPLLQGSTTYRLEFTSGPRRLFLQMVQNAYAPVGFGGSAWPQPATAGRVGGRSYHVHGEQDTEANEIRFEAPLTAFGRGSVKPGDVLGGVAVAASRTYTDNGQLAPGVSSRVSVTDTAAGPATYVAGTPSCVLPDYEEPDPAP